MIIFYYLLIFCWSYLLTMFIFEMISNKSMLDNHNIIQIHNNIVVGMSLFHMIFLDTQCGKYQGILCKILLVPLQYFLRSDKKLLLRKSPTPKSAAT